MTGHHRKDPPTFIKKEFPYYLFPNDESNTWGQMLPPILYAFREIPNESTGYAPFSLMYGRGINKISKEYIFFSEYAKTLKDTTDQACKVAFQNASTGKTWNL